MYWVKLTRADNREGKYVNLFKAIGMADHATFTRIMFSADDYLDVKETPEQILTVQPEAVSGRGIGYE